MKKTLLFLAIGLSWSIGQAQDDQTPLYTSLGEVAPTEGWGDTPMPVVRDIVVDGYENSIVIKAFAGVEGYDLEVGFGANDAVTYITAIENGEAVGTTTGGYLTINTGLEDLPTMNAYLGQRYCYGNSDASTQSGYFIVSAYFDEVWAYYFLVWPQGDDSETDWTNPFETEATYLYSATAQTGNYSEWGNSVVPQITDIKVDVYDTYIYIHGIGGVEGYDAKIAYDAEDIVTSMISIVDGKESSPCKTYLYLITGNPDFPTIQAYTGGYSYAGISNDNSGYVLLGAYIYNADDSYSWNYYYLYWEDGESTSIGTLLNDNTDPNSPIYNLSGQKVSPAYRGLIINNGKLQFSRH